MSYTPSKPREFWLYDNGEEPFLAFYGLGSLEADTSNLQYKIIHVVEYSALVAAQVEIEKLKAELNLIKVSQEKYQSGEWYRIRESEYDALVNERDKLKSENERLTNQYNEQLDLARHRAVELERAKAENDILEDDVLRGHERESDLYKELNGLNWLKPEVERLNTLIHEEARLILENNELKLMAESLNAKLAKAVSFLKQGKAKFSPHTTNSFVDEFIENYERALSEQGDEK